MLNYTAANKTGGAVHESLCYTFGQIYDVHRLFWRMSTQVHEKHKLVYWFSKNLFLTVFLFSQAKYISFVGEPSGESGCLRTSSDVAVVAFDGCALASTLSVDKDWSNLGAPSSDSGVGDEGLEKLDLGEVGLDELEWLDGEKLKKDIVMLLLREGLLFLVGVVGLTAPALGKLIFFWRNVCNRDKEQTNTFEKRRQILLKRGDKYFYLFMLCLCILVEGCQRVGWYRSVFWKDLVSKGILGLEWYDLTTVRGLSISLIDCFLFLMSWFTLSIELFRLDRLETVKCLLKVGVVKPSFWLIADCTDVRPGKIGFSPTLKWHYQLSSIKSKTTRPDFLRASPLEILDRFSSQSDGLP